MFQQKINCIDKKKTFKWLKIEKNKLHVQLCRTIVKFYICCMCKEAICYDRSYVFI